MNKIIVNGNLVKDMDVKITGESVIGNFTIANNEGFGDYEKTSFINCTMFGENRINALEKYLLKGAKVLINGTLQITSKEYNGENKYFTNVVVDTLEIEKFINDDEEEKTTKKKGKRR